MTEKKEKKEKIPRQPMPEQEAQVRAKNFDEVPFGYSPEAAMKEAARCLQCKKPACVAGCPVSVDIPGFIDLIKDRAPFPLDDFPGKSKAGKLLRPFGFVIDDFVDEPELYIMKAIRV